MRFLSWDCANKTLAYAYLTIDIHIYAKIRIIKQLIIDSFVMHFGVNLCLSKFNWEKLYTEINNINIDNDNIAIKLNEFLLDLTDYIDCLNYFVSNAIVIHKCDVVDIIGNHKVADISEVERAKSLHTFLHKLDKELSLLATPVFFDSPILSVLTVIIEHQPAKMNSATGSVANLKSIAVSNQLAYHYAQFDTYFIDPKHKNKISLRDDLTYDSIYAEVLPKHKSVHAAKYSARKLHTSRNLRYLLDIFDLTDSCSHIPARVFDDAADAVMEVFAYCVEKKLFV